MTEAQDAQRETSTTEDLHSRRSSRQVTIGAHSWVIVDLEDGLSWSVYAASADGAVTGPRLAQIAVTEQGYFSTEPNGRIRGPYTTLDEAAYPLAMGERVLLDDPEDAAPVAAPDRPGAVRAGSRPKRHWIVLVVTVAAVVLLARRSRLHGVPERR